MAEQTSQKQKTAAISHALEQYGERAILQPSPAGFRILWDGALPQLVTDPPDAQILALEVEPPFEDAEEVG